MGKRSSRRNFMKSTAALGVGFWAAGGVTPRQSRAAIEEIRFACIGIGGKGSSDSDDARNSGKVVAICDIDENTLGGAKDKFPGAKHYTDFRQLLEENKDSIDAVTVSTPDHTHAPAALMAMRMGKHCFCQKPMTHSIYEARLMTEVAKEKKLVTQMGNQGTAGSTLRKSAALIKEGAIGTVKEVHIWTNRPVWPQGLDQPTASEEIPSNVKWDLWLGPAPERHFNSIYHPFKWRGWWDFGTGALGDMACHTLNMSFMALNLRDPISVQATTSGHNKQTYPKWSEIEYMFPEYEGRAAVKMVWYDGGKLPPEELLKGCPMQDGKLYSSGALVVGDKGSLFSPGDYGGDDENTGILANGEFTKQKDIKGGKFQRSPGHFTEFAMGIKGELTPVSNFQTYAGPLTEVVLLGNLAVWVAAGEGKGQKVEWDAKTMTAKDANEEVQRIIKPVYRKGYTLEG